MMQLATKLPDLTMLASNNNGVFPFDRVYQVIDGRAGVEGPRYAENDDMGPRFSHAKLRVS